MKSYLILFAIIVFTLIQVLIFTLPHGEQQYSYLSQSFLKGKFDLGGYPYGNDDLAIYGGKSFWPLGPFPSIIITPFVFVASLFNVLFLHKYIHWLFVIGVFCLVYKLARKLDYNQPDSFMWALAFNLGSVFIGVSFIPWSWYFSQVICTFLILLALLEFYNKKNYLLIGFIFACILLTRVTASLGLLFFLLEILSSRKKRIIKVKNIALLTIPVLAALLIMAGYNYARFGNIFEQGYKYQVIGEKQNATRKYGLISLKHVPGNIYYFLFAPPRRVFQDEHSMVLKFPYFTFDTWSLGIIFTSAYFLKLLSINYRINILKNLLLTALIVAVPIFMFYGIGFTQYGYRYSLDFLPYLFLVLLIYTKKHGLSRGFKLAIFLSILINSYLFVSLAFI